MAQTRGGRRERVGVPFALWWWLVLGAGMVPALVLGLRTLGLWGGLGVNPVETLVHDSGTYAIISLLVALAVTPVRQLMGWSALARLRRLFGLIAFAYASLHVFLWLAVDLFFDWVLILDDLTLRPYITVGFAAWLILLALALTSTQAAMRRLRKHWVRLHRLVYLAGGLALLHIVWLTRADYREVMLYAVVLAVLLGWRVAFRLWSMR